MAHRTRVIYHHAGILNIAAAVTSYGTDVVLAFLKLCLRPDKYPIHTFARAQGPAIE